MLRIEYYYEAMNNVNTMNGDLMENGSILFQVSTTTMIDQIILLLIILLSASSKMISLFVLES